MRDVLARRTSRLEYALFVKTNFHGIVVGEDCDVQNLKYNIRAELFNMALAKSGGDKNK